MARLEYVLKTEILSSGLTNSLDFVSYFFLLFFPFLVIALIAVLWKRRVQKDPGKPKSKVPATKSKEPTRPVALFYFFLGYIRKLNLQTYLHTYVPFQLSYSLETPNGLYGINLQKQEMDVIMMGAI